MPSRRPTPSRQSPSSKARVPRRPASGPGGSGRVDDQLCFALYCATNAIQRAYAAPLKALGLTYLQYLVLLVLLERDERTVGDIGRSLYLDSGTVTPVLRRLEGLGLVTRRRAIADEREVHVALTPAGRELESALSRVRVDVGCRTGLEIEAIGKLRDELRSLQARLTSRPA